MRIASMQVQHLAAARAKPPAETAFARSIKSALVAVARVLSREHSRKLLVLRIE